MTRRMPLFFMSIVLVVVSVAEGQAPAVDLALQPPPINTHPGPEYDDSTRAFQGIPGIERGRMAASGRCGTRVGREKAA